MARSDRERWGARYRRRLKTEARRPKSTGIQSIQFRPPVSPNIWVGILQDRITPEPFACLQSRSQRAKRTISALKNSGQLRPDTPKTPWRARSHSPTRCVRAPPCRASSRVGKHRRMGVAAAQRRATTPSNEDLLTGSCPGRRGPTCGQSGLRHGPQRGRQLRHDRRRAAPSTGDSEARDPVPAPPRVPRERRHRGEPAHARAAVGSRTAWGSEPACGCCHPCPDDSRKRSPRCGRRPPTHTYAPNSRISRSKELTHRHAHARRRGRRYAPTAKERKNNLLRR